MQQTYVTGQEPAVSIVIPTFNGEAYLQEALESALAQTWTDMEILVCDDRSTDGTVALVENFCRRDARVRLFRNPERLGLAGNWNQCVKKAKGTWIKFLFQDDVLHPDCVRKMMAVSKEHDFILCERDFLVADDADPALKDFYENWVIRIHHVIRASGSLSPETVSRAIIDHGPGSNFFGEPPSVLVKKSLAERYGLFSERYVHVCDLEFWTRLACNVGVFYVPESLVSFRVHSRSASMDNHRFRKFEVECMDQLTLLWDYETCDEYSVLRSAGGAAEALAGHRAGVLEKGYANDTLNDAGEAGVRFKALAGLMARPRASVSAVIPCYGCSSTLERALASIAGQTLLPQEVILVDDGSPDTTWQCIQRIQNVYGPGWIKAIRLPENKGAGDARNAGWEAAAGRYIAFLDADDTWHPEKIAVQYALMQENDSCTASGHAHGRYPAGISQEPPKTQRISAWSLLLKNAFKTPTVMIRRDTPFRFATGKRYCEDYLLWCEMGFRGCGLLFVDQPLAQIHKPSYGSGGLSRNLNAMEAGELDVFKRLYASGLISGASAVAAMMFSLVKYLKRRVRVWAGAWE